MEKLSTIKEIFSETDFFADKVSSKLAQTEAYKKAREEEYKAINNFLEKLTPELKEQFEEIFNKICNAGSVYADEAIAEGFRYGLLVAFEACTE